MLNDFFQSLNFEFPWERFVALPRHPAYRYQYREGKASISGNPRYYHCVLPLNEQTTARKEPAGKSVSCFFSEFDLRRLHESDWKQFSPLFAAAFQQPPPLLQLTEAQRLSAAQALLERTRTGGDGPIVPEASWVFEDRDTGELLAAILITLVPVGDVSDFTHHSWAQAAPPNALETGWGQPHLTWIFVSPHKQRRSLGSLLLREAASALLRMGYPELVSTFLLGDHASMLWHWRNGFQLAGHPASPGQARDQRTDSPPDHGSR